MEVIENGNLIGSINGTVVGGATLVAGKKGFALNTNGVDQYVDFGCQGDTCLGSISLCTHGWVTTFWVQGIDRHCAIVDAGMYGKERVLIHVYDFNLLARFWAPNNMWEASIQLPSKQDWIHIVVAWQPCCGVKLYIDGELVAIDNLPSNPNIPPYDKPRFVLGALNTYAYIHKMALDELRVWDTVMSDEEVLALYMVDAGLKWDISYWCICLPTGD